MAEIFEVVMVLCFGVSWPLSIYKSYKSRSSKGKSIVFLCFILIGYIFGIAAKLISGNITYVLIFYILNAIMVSIDAILYFRNKGLEKKENNF